MAAISCRRAGLLTGLFLPPALTWAQQMPKGFVVLPIELGQGFTHLPLLALGVAPGVVNDALAQAGNPFKNTSLTTIHQLRPATKLVEAGPGGLTFDPAAMRGMLEKGYAQAKAYFAALPAERFNP